MAGSVDILAQLPQLESLCERLYNSQASTQSPPFIVPQITSTLPYSLLWICSVSYSPVFEYPDNHQVCRMLPKEPTLSKCCASVLVPIYWCIRTLHGALQCSLPIKLEMRNYFMAYLDRCVSCPLLHRLLPLHDCRELKLLCFACLQSVLDPAK